MPIQLRQATASQEVPLGYFLDSGTGDDEETGLTIANTDIKLWKQGATVLADKNSGGAVHISNGVYYCVLDATDTDTLGSLIIFCHVSGALPIRVECVVLPPDIYDALHDSLTPWTLEVGEVVNGVFDQLAAGNQLEGSFGKLLNDTYNAVATTGVELSATALVALIHGLLDHDRTDHNAADSVCRGINLIIAKMFHQFNTLSGTVYDADGNSLGTMPYSEATNVRSKFNGAL